VRTVNPIARQLRRHLNGKPSTPRRIRAVWGMPAQATGALINLRTSCVNPNRCLYALFWPSQCRIGAPSPARLEIAAVVENRYVLANAKFSGFHTAGIHHFRWFFFFFFSSPAPFLFFIFFFSLLRAAVFLPPLLPCPLPPRIWMLLRDLPITSSPHLHVTSTGVLRASFRHPRKIRPGNVGGLRPATNRHHRGYLIHTP